eukprot:TRINITY_DN7440_c0_g2_i2.p1 TRINITY_DN7440_c0_g2~~TRINITY_DN7440_c0_g2_i2.p1  ORF type:complete len:126 (+),score=37.34 TRINITY_DN7440_c0_g2_i2:353-730(+)
MLASAIQLKNLMRCSWTGVNERDEKELAALSIEDKEYLKVNMLKCLAIPLPKLILRQLEECFYIIANAEFPDAWPSFLSQIKEGLTKTEGEQQVYGVLNPLTLSLIHICRCRRYAVCRSRWSPYH